MSGPAPLRVVLAVGDAALEARLGRELPAAGVVIRSRALDGPGLLAEARAPGVDAVLVDARLHRLDAAMLDELRRLRVPVVILGADAAATAPEGNVVPVGSTVASIAAALHAAPRHAPLPPSPVAPEDLAEEGERARVVVVAGGKGAPGRTFVAIALADVLGAAEDEVVLVDGDLRGGNVAPYLDLDPRRGLLAVAGGPDPLPARLAAALQPGAHSAVLSGIERPELARRLPAGFLAEVVDQLRVGRDWVLVDAGHPAPPGLLAIASDIVVVTGADLVSVWNTRVALPALRDAAPAARLHLVVNRREGREHYTAAEIGVVLALPVLGAVREDRGGARRAIAARRPLSAVGGGAARDLRALAAALAAGAPQPTAPVPASAGAIALGDA